MTRPRFSVRDLVAATGVIALLLAVFVRAPTGTLLSIFPAAIILCAHFWFARVPLRVRLAVAISLLVVLFVVITYASRDQNYLNLANDADRLAQLAETLAEEAGVAKEEARYRRIAAHFSRRATVLRRKSLLGLSRRPEGFPADTVIVTDDNCLDVFNIVEVRERLEAEKASRKNRAKIQKTRKGP